MSVKLNTIANTHNTQGNHLSNVAGGNIIAESKTLILYSMSVAQSRLHFSHQQQLQ